MDDTTGEVFLKSYDVFTMYKDSLGGTEVNMDSMQEQSIILDDGSWWIAGGRGSRGGRQLKKTWKYDQRDEIMRPGPDLPGGTDSDECLVQVNSTHLVMTALAGKEGYVFDKNNPSAKFEKFTFTDMSDGTEIVRTRCGVDRINRKVVIIRQIK